MIAFVGSVVGAAALSAQVAGVAATVDVALGPVVDATVRVGVAAAKVNASGRPGPNVVTDQFRSGIDGRTARTGDGWVGAYGSDAAQAWRLEAGFVGPDSLGRVFNQPPYPWLGPTVGPVSEFFVGRAGAAVRGVLS